MHSEVYNPPTLVDNLYLVLIIITYYNNTFLSFCASNIQKDGVFFHLEMLFIHVNHDKPDFKKKLNYYQIHCFRSYYI